jgi:hypothetical protein
VVRSLLFGVACSVMAVIVIIGGQLLDLNFQNVLVGIAAGAVLGLVRIGSPVARFGAFLIGFATGAVFYLLKSLVFPQTWAGNTIAVVLTIMLLTLVSTLTRDRIALWAMFVGTLVFTAAYDGFFNATPWLVTSQGPVIAGGILLCVAAGFLVTLLVEVREARLSVSPIDPMMPLEPTAVDPPAAVPSQTQRSDVNASSVGLSVLTAQDRKDQN